MCYLLAKKKRGLMTVVSNAQHCNIHMWPLFYGCILCIDGVGNQMHSKFV